MRKTLLALFICISMTSVHGQQTEKKPCAYIADPEYIKTLKDKSSVFSRRLEFVKKTPKSERAKWGSLRLEKGRFISIPRGVDEWFPKSIVEKQDITEITNALDKIMGSLLYVPVVAHIVRRSNGTGGLNTADLNASIDRANRHFFMAGMRLELCSVRYIDSDRLYGFYYDDDTTLASVQTPALLDVESRNVAGKVNIYCVPSATTSWAWRPTTNPKIQHVLFRNDHIQNESTFSHELGHWFGLMHTHGGSDDELVNGSNCSTEGDLVCDTPADPNLSGRVNGSCAYTGNVRDANDRAYTPDPTNILSYAPKPCRTRFTSDQTDIMQAVYYGVAEERGFSFRPCMTTYCFNMRLRDMVVIADGNTWRIRCTGTTRIIYDININFSFPFDSEEDARSVLQVLQSKSSLELCFLSGSSMYYFTQNGAPVVLPGNANCIDIDPGTLQVQRMRDGRFQLGNLGGRSNSFIFNSRSDAEESLFALKRYGFKKACIKSNGFVMLGK